MDLSIYYEEFQTVYILGNFVIILMFLVTVFLFVRRHQDTKSIRERILLYVIYILLFVLVLSYYFHGPYLCKKDINRKTIYAYEGDFEVIETTSGIYNKAMFLIDGEELCLQYFKDDEYDFDIIQPGKYEGKIVYAQHVSKILHIEIYNSK